jgi:hypothetical protein
MKTAAIAAALVLVATTSFAQKPASPDANTPAVTTPSTPKNPKAPVEGANSFTEGQARSRIEKEGFTNVTGLKKDDKGVWRGSATKGSQKVNVSVDFQGNVTTN